MTDPPDIAVMKHGIPVDFVAGYCGSSCKACEIAVRPR
jgi:hypothetical protein